MTIITPVAQDKILKLRKELFGDQDITKLPQYIHSLRRGSYLSKKVANFITILQKDPNIKWWDLLGKISWIAGRKAIRNKVIPDFEKVLAMYLRASVLPINQMVNIADFEFNKLIKLYGETIKSSNAVFEIKDDPYVK